MEQEIKSQYTEETHNSIHRLHYLHTHTQLHIHTHKHTLLPVFPSATAPPSHTHTHTQWGSYPTPLSIEDFQRSVIGNGTTSVMENSLTLNAGEIGRAHV